jgi:hypothetical protein
MVSKVYSVLTIGPHLIVEVDLEMLVVAYRGILPRYRHITCRIVRQYQQLETLWFRTVEASVRS